MTEISSEIRNENKKEKKIIIYIKRKFKIKKNLVINNIIAFINHY
jgi:hypothetical protein